MLSHEQHLQHPSTGAWSLWHEAPSIRHRPSASLPPPGTPHVQPAIRRRSPSATAAPPPPPLSSDPQPPAPAQQQQQIAPIDPANVQTRGAPPVVVVDPEARPARRQSPGLEITEVRRVARGAAKRWRPMPTAAAAAAAAAEARAAPFCLPDNRGADGTGADGREGARPKRPAARAVEDGQQRKRMKMEGGGGGAWSRSRFPAPILAASRSTHAGIGPPYHGEGAAAGLPRPTQATETDRTCSSPPIPQWTPRSWRPSHYSRLADVLYQSFPLQQFAREMGKDPREVEEVFSGIVSIPLQQQASYGADGGDGGERRMDEYKRLEAQLRALHAREDREYKLGMRAQLMSEMGKELEEAAKERVWMQVRKEGWVKIEKAKDMIGEHERVVKEEMDRSKDAGGGKGRRILSVSEAMQNMLTASEGLNKAKKAEERRNKNQRKREGGDEGDGGEKKTNMGRQKKKNKEEKGGKGYGM